MEEQFFYSWLAGFVDGDGCFSIPLSLRKTDRETTYISINSQITIGLKYNDKWILEHIKKETGCGNVYVRHYRNDKLVTWQTTNINDTHNILKRIIPYLILKKERAKAFLELLEKMMPYYNISKITKQRMAGKATKPKELMLEIAKVATSLNLDRQKERYKNYKGFEYWKRIIDELYDN